MLLSAKFIADAVIEQDDQESTFIEKVRVLPSVGYPEFFSNTDVCRELFNLWKNSEADIEISDIEPFQRSSCYCQITAGNNELEVVYLRPVLEAASIPSSAERIVAFYIAKTGEQGVLAVPIDKGIFFWASKESKERLRGHARSISCTIEAAISYASQTLASSEVKILENGELFNRSGVASLLKGAILEKSIRWKYLGYYRLFESGYLHEILKELEKNFLSAAKESLDEALEKTKNELSQFINIADKPGLKEIFENIGKKIKSDSSCLFLFALKRQASKDSRYKSYGGDVFKEGVYFCYAIRCSIVHAGDSHLVFDKYEDASSGLLLIMQDLEEAVFRYIGISLK